MASGQDDYKQQHMGGDSQIYFMVLVQHSPQETEGKQPHA